MFSLVPQRMYKARNKLHAVWFLFLGISAVLHGILITLLFFAYHYDTIVANITLHKDMPLVRFAPMSAASSVVSQPIKKSVGSLTGTKTATSVAQAQPKSKPTPVVAAPKVQVQEIVKEKPKGTRAALISETAVRKSKDTKSKDKTVKDKNKKKEKPLVVAKTKPVTKDKEIVTKDVPKTAVVEQKSVEPNREEKIEVVQQPIAVPNEEQVAVNADMLPQDLAMGDNCEVALGQTIDDPRLFQYYTQLQTAVSDTWKPPLGISDECVCDVLVQLDLKGLVKEIKVVKSSGVLIYDIAARNALQDAKMPKWSYGKTITVSFKQ